MLYLYSVFQYIEITYYIQRKRCLDKKTNMVTYFRLDYLTTKSRQPARGAPTARAWAGRTPGPPVYHIISVTQGLV